MNDDVASAFEAYPAAIRRKLLALRKLIFATAAQNAAIGPLTETLKWGEPAYLTEQTRAGSTIRLGWKASAPTQYALYFNCRTRLVDDFRTRFPELQFSGNRALLLDAAEAVPTDAVSCCIEMALTYHLAKRRAKAS